MRGIFQEHSRLTELIGLYRGGTSQGACALHFGTTPITVRRALAGAGVAIRSIRESNSAAAVRPRYAKVFDSQKRANAEEAYRLYRDEHWSTPKLAERFRVTPATILNWFGKLGVTTDGVPHAPKRLLLNEAVFDTPYSEESAYFLGLLATDGSLDTARNTISLGLAAKDGYMVERFRAFLQTDAPVRVTPAGQHRLRVVSRKLSQRLQELGFNSRKSWGFKISDAALVQNRHFLRGAYDGDGSFGVYDYPAQKMYRATLSSSAKDFIAQVRAALDDAGITTSLSVTTPESRKKTGFRLSADHYRIQVSSPVGMKALMNYLYGGATVFLTRKFQVGADAGFY